MFVAGRTGTHGLVLDLLKVVVVGAAILLISVLVYMYYEDPRENFCGGWCHQKSPDCGGSCGGPRLCGRYTLVLRPSIPPVGTGTMRLTTAGLRGRG